MHTVASVAAPIYVLWTVVVLLARSAYQVVLPGVTIDRVNTRVAFYVVIAVIAVHPVIAAPTEQEIVAAVAFHCVVATGDHRADRAGACHNIEDIDLAHG